MYHSDAPIFLGIAYFLSIFIIGLPNAYWRHKVWLNEMGWQYLVCRLFFPFTHGEKDSGQPLVNLRNSKSTYLAIVAILWPANIVFNIVVVFLEIFLSVGILLASVLAVPWLDRMIKQAIEKQSLRRFA